MNTLDAKTGRNNKVDIATLVRAAFYHKLDDDEIFNPKPETSSFNEYKAKAKWFIDIKTGKIVYVTEDDLEAARSYDPDPDDDMDMERYYCTLGPAIDIAYDREDRYRLLPKADAIEQERFDREFVQYMELALDELRKAIRSSNSEQTFPDCISRYSLTERWDEFRQRQVIIQWCQENKIEWEEDQR